MSASRRVPGVGIVFECGAINLAEGLTLVTVGVLGQQVRYE